MLRFISHHDLMRLFERALRRSGLPLKLSEGFNPRPVMSLPAALALGVESNAEIAEVELREWVSPARANHLLTREMPPGIGILRVQSVRYGEKTEVIGAQYSVRLGVAASDFAQKLNAFLDCDRVMIERTGKFGTKSVNVRSFVKDARLDGDTLWLHLSVSPAGSVRPEEVLEAVLRQPLRSLAPLYVMRTRLELSSPP